MTRDRGESGQYIDTVIPEDVLSVFDQVTGPVVTSADVADALECSRETARRKLSQLAESGHVARRKTAGRVVWWLTEDTDETNSPHEQAFEEFAARAMEAHGEHIEEIILFGSTARGETRGVDSDVDVFVVVDTMEIKDALGEIAYDVMHKHGVVVAEVVKPKELVENNADHPLVKTVRREGRAYA